ncbi:hypothetical protein CPB83DRAFT_878765 [Crepidotus variabilis]|uniref:ABC transporter domain-containing protein n=1 Tax=Crepidotus variabilis TaxID=179855 RepID=A0A9P6EV35_9AGAR|nr:hypothetical protein CPB83DRAFT_878765 [Crepidotus variabilis]
MGAFWLQLRVLIWKNWIVLSKHPLLTILRCFILPIAYGAFLATAQLFLSRLNNYGIGTAVPVKSLQSQFDSSLALIWVDGTNGMSSPNPKDIMAHITSGFTSKQLAAVRQMSNASDIPNACPQNFNLYSQCFAAISFTDIPPNGSQSRAVNYTIFADTGLVYINVEKHTSDFEKRILPLQWSIDKAIIELKTGVQQQTPLEWPYTEETNEEQLTRLRLSYLRGIRQLIGLAFFLTFVGISYQLPGAVASERALLITEHMKAMGLLDSARILSWHISISLTYLPAWIIVALVWKARVFSESNAGIVILVHLLLGLVLGSWSFFVAAPFGKSPQLAAVVTTFLAIVCAILGLVLNGAKGGSVFIFSILFPPSFYIFALRVMVGFNNHQLATNVLDADPDTGARLLPILIAAIIDIFLWPYLAVLWERSLYEAPIPGKRSSWKFWQKKSPYKAPPVPENVAISIRDLTKIYKTSRFSSKGKVTAVSGLSLDIPKTGIFVLLGSNGAGKSTSLSVVAGISSITSGTVTFEGGVSRPPKGTIGIVPQKNVLFPELNCLQTLRVWRAVKWSSNSDSSEDLEQLLKDCDLQAKINANASTLSGGQKRKLQLAIGLLGGSKVVLVDECTSGVDPLSRRALWRTLTAFREDRCIVFTTHFLDEADLLADHIVILAAPGKVVANGSPVALKRDLGKGYSLQITHFTPVHLEKSKDSFHQDLLKQIRNVVPSAYATLTSSEQSVYHLETRNAEQMQQILDIADAETDKGRIVSYNILGTTIEDIFLDLMKKNDASNEEDEEKGSTGTLSPTPSPLPRSSDLTLATGRSVSPFTQALTIFRKRIMISRRSWLTPVLTLLVAVCAACIPLIFTTGKRQSCTVRFRNTTTIPLYLPSSPLLPLIALNPDDAVLSSPPGLIRMLGDSTYSLKFRVKDIQDNSTFVNTVQNSYRNITYGGISIDPNTGQSLVAWEATAPGFTGPSMLNLATNILYNRALNASGFSASTPSFIKPSYALFPPVSLGTLVSLRWLFFFGAAMAVYPAFFALYVSKERRSSVQAMQFSNGLTNPLGLWLGHLMFDTITVVALSTVITIVFAAVGNQLHGLGYLWFILVLYGITAALFAYSVSLMVSSPLAAFATVAGYQFVIFILYLSSYLLVLTYAPVTQATRLITIIHFTVSIVAPVASVVRAALVSANLFSLLCDGTETVTAASFGSIKRFGGPILYLFIYMFVLLGILFWADSGSRPSPKRLKKRLVSTEPGEMTSKEDVATAAISTEESNDLLKVLNVSKLYNGKRVVDDVTLGVPKDTIFALLGPNGAGKTTTFNIIRGDVLPDVGDVFIDGTSVIRHPRTARSHLGVCPQFTAIDSQLTVREHLIIYGRLKGLRQGPELLDSIEVVLVGTSLTMYADRLASKLSGGNQRKLSLAIALIGNPSVILIDEFSTGIDPKMKRDMWQTLRRVSVGKAVIITTHSMEEASALASSVGILAKRMLAVGTTESLSARYATYEVHFTCRNREEVVRARTLMASIPGSRMADDVATRFEVPVSQNADYSLSKLFNTLARNGDFTEYTVEKATLESVFLKVIRENNVGEEDSHTRRWWNFWSA